MQFWLIDFDTLSFSLKVTFSVAILFLKYYCSVIYVVRMQMMASATLYSFLKYLTKTVNNNICL
jgi:hypothetical protein